MQPFQIRVVGHVDFNNDLPGENSEAGRVAHRSGGHDMALLGNGHGFDHGNIRQLELGVTQLFDGFRQVLVDEHHLASVDGLAQRAVDLEWHAPGQYAGFGEFLVEVVTQARPRHQADFQRRDLGALSQGVGHCFRFSGAGKAAHADGHAVLNQQGCFGSAHNFVQQRRQADAVTVHGWLSRAGSKVRSLLNSRRVRPATKVAFKASITGVSGKTLLLDR